MRKYMSIFDPSHEKLIEFIKRRTYECYNGLAC